MSVSGRGRLRRAMAWACGDVPPGLAAILMVVIATLTVSTSRYVAVWSSELTLWSRAAVLAPHKPRPLNNLGVALVSTGHFADARSWFERAHQAGHAPTLPAWDRVEGEQTARANLKALADITARLEHK